jgi:Subtilase family
MHQFGAAKTNTAQFLNAPLGGGWIVLQWTDPFATVTGPPGAAHDIDLLLFDSAGRFRASSSSANIGGDPVEYVLLPEGQSLLAICAYGANKAPPVRLKWIYSGSDLNEIIPDTKSSTSFGHPNARHTAGVGAAWFENTPEFGQTPPLPEPFTSRGGTPILFNDNGKLLATPERRLQPRFVAVDGTSTTFFGRSNRFFFGTSAAAPNCAAIALLLLQAQPRWRPREVYAVLAATAVDMGPPGFDFDTGAGLVDAWAALAAAPAAAQDKSSNKCVRRCVLVNLATLQETELTGDDSYVPNRSGGRGHSIRCDIVTSANDDDGPVSLRVSFAYDGRVHQENSGPYWMNGERDSTGGRQVSRAKYLQSCGPKTITVWAISSFKDGGQEECFRQTFQLQTRCRGGVRGL